MASRAPEELKTGQLGTRALMIFDLLCAVREALRLLEHGRVRDAEERLTKALEYNRRIGGGA